MGFLDKAKAAANELAQKADTALAGSGLGGPGARCPTPTGPGSWRRCGTWSSAARSAP